MTCIVGYLDKKSNKVWIGGDSAGVAGLNLSIRKDEKVFTVGDFVIGCTTSFRMIQLLRYSLKLPEIKTKDVYEYMCTEFIASVRACFKDGGYLRKYTEGDEKGGSFLVAHKNRLFCIEDDFQVAENRDGMMAVGCGASYALGSLYAITKYVKIIPHETVLRSLEAAAYNSAGVCGPFVIKST